MGKCLTKCLPRPRPPAAHPGVGKADVEVSRIGRHHQLGAVLAQRAGRVCRRGRAWGQMSGAMWSTPRATENGQ